MREYRTIKNIKNDKNILKDDLLKEKYNIVWNI